MFDLHLYNATSILFVCTGDVCRGPIAEAVFNELARQRGESDKWYVESIGTTGWHVDQSPDERAMDVLKKHKIPYSGHTAIKLRHEDFYRFKYMFGMDQSNIDDINRMKPDNSKVKVLLLGSYDPKGETIIEDPYYDSDHRDFERVYQQCLRSCTAFLDKHK